MKNLSLSRLACVGPLAVLLAGLLSGCDRLKQIDELPARAEASRVAIAALQLEVATAKKEITELRDDLGATKARLLLAELSAQQATATKKAAEPQPISGESLATLTAAIAGCVQVAREIPAQDEMEARFYKRFDAYYNPGNGLVQNNARYNGEMPALYAFNKCMVAKGFPLK